MLAALLCPLPAAGQTAATTHADDEEQSSLLYRTPEEKREAGIEHELTPWLTIAGLLEWETTRERFSGAGISRTENESEGIVELDIEVTLLEALTGEAVLEYDTETDKLIADEAVVALEYESWELSVGKQYLPFGVFYSRFVTGPLIEFGETRVAAATLAYDLNDRLELSASLYRGRARRANGESRDTGVALAVGARPTDRLSAGLAYMDNLANADGRPLEDEDNRFAREVPGLSGYVLWSAEDYEVSLEALGATRSFDELDLDRDRPFAWNAEFVHFLHPRFDWALRVEGSEDLEDAPALQYGVAGNARLHEQVFLTVELMRGRFEGELAADDDDNPYEHVNRIGVLLSVAF